MWQLQRQVLKTRRVSFMSNSRLYFKDEGWRMQSWKWSFLEYYPFDVGENILILWASTVWCCIFMNLFSFYYIHFLHISVRSLIWLDFVSCHCAVLCCVWDKRTDRQGRLKKGKSILHQTSEIQKEPNHYWGYLSMFAVGFFFRNVGSQ